MIEFGILLLLTLLVLDAILLLVTFGMEARTNRRRRQIDIDVLWPSIRSRAANIDQAHTAMMLHCAQDQAWFDLDDEEVETIVESLR